MVCNKQTNLERLNEGMQQLLSLWCHLVFERNRMDGRKKRMRTTVIEEMKRVEEAQKSMRQRCSREKIKKVEDE